MGVLQHCVHELEGETYLWENMKIVDICCICRS
jgi:hypothetical protein